MYVFLHSSFFIIHKIFNNSYIICRGIHLSKSLTKNSFGLYDNIPPTIRGIHVLIAVHTINIIFFINLCIIPYIYVFNDITLMPNKYHVCNGNFLIKLLSKPLISIFTKISDDCSYSALDSLSEKQLYQISILRTYLEV